jgi:hypothetical protein
MRRIHSPSLVRGSTHSTKKTASALCMVPLLHALAPRAIAAHVECRRAIPAGGHRPELETARALPRSARGSRIQCSLRHKTEPGESSSERHGKSNSIHGNAHEPCLLVSFSTDSIVCGRRQNARSKSIGSRRGARLFSVCPPYIRTRVCLASLLASRVMSRFPSLTPIFSRKARGGSPPAKIQT